MRQTRRDAVDVLHVTRSTNAGVRRHLVDLVLGLHALGVRQALAYDGDDADPGFHEALPRFLALGIEARELPMDRALSPRRDLASARALVSLARELRPCVMHLHSSKAGGIGRLAALALPRLPVVYTPHASAAHVSRAYAGIERLLGRLRTDRLLAVSPSERAELARLGFVVAGRLAVVECGIDADEVRAAAEEPCATLPAGPLVVSAGRLSEQKDPLLFVRAAAAIALAVPDAHFVWVGDGELRAAVERAAADAGLAGRLTITGWLANPHPLLARASVFVLASRYESFGYVTLESMALGRPVVATDVAGSRDLVVDGETGRLVPAGDAVALAAAVVRLLGDPATAARMGAAGAARAAGYTRSRMAAGVLDVYRELAGSPLPRS